MPPMPERVLLLLLAVRAEIRSLQQEAETLPSAAAAPMLARAERLSARSRRLAKSTAARMRSH